MHIDEFPVAELSVDLVFDDDGENEAQDEVQSLGGATPSVKATIARLANAGLFLPEYRAATPRAYEPNATAEPSNRGAIPRANEPNQPHAQPTKQAARLQHVQE